MIDWDALVLAPLQSIFGAPVVVTPTVSQPRAPAYLARGVFSVKQITVKTAEGEFTDQQPTLSIRLADYPVPPKQGDSVLIGGTNLAPSLNPMFQSAPSLTTVGGVLWNVFDAQPDGQGGADLVLKQDD